jgi:hypothetical protein
MSAMAVAELLSSNERRPGCAVCGSGSASLDRRSEVSRPFFTAAIATVLTVGALWGVTILIRIALSGSFTAVGLHEVNAHGHAQIFGWVGLFVMGFAYRVFPVLLGRDLPCTHGARYGWIAMLVGVVLRSGLQPFVVAHPWLLVPAHLGSVLEIAAVAVFSIQMLWLLGAAPGRLLSGSAWLIRVALGCFFVQTIASAVYFHLTAVATDRESLLWLISHLQPSLRDLQVHGFAMLMVLGVGMTLLPLWFGVRRLGPRGAMIAAVLLGLAVVGEITGFQLMQSVTRRWAALWGLSALVMFVTALWIVLRSNVLWPYPMISRSSKFIRAAHAWLLISLGMLVLLPVWQFVVLTALAPGSHAVEIGFSHAYYGSIRHAITVGFISMMILGMGSRFMERTADPAVVPHWSLTVPFVLVNIGCAMRVGFQALTDLHAMAFPIAGVSGILELSGIAVWAVWMLRCIYGLSVIPSEQSALTNSTSAPSAL